MARLTLDQVRRYMQDTEPVEPETPATPPAPGERPEVEGVPIELDQPETAESRATPTPPPVEGVNDYLANQAYWNSQAGEEEDERTPALVPTEENLDRFLRRTLNREATPDERDFWQENVRSILSRGRMLERNFPYNRMGDTPGSIAWMVQDADEERRLRETAGGIEQRYHSNNPNPPFANIRSGPARTDSAIYGSGERDQGALATYLERMGVHPDIANYYRTDAVSMAPITDRLGVGGDAGGGRIRLSDFLRRADEQGVVRTAQHEAVHRYDEDRGYRNPSPSWDEMTPYEREAVSQGYGPAPEDTYTAILAAAQAGDPEAMAYLAAVPEDDPYRSAHTFTAPFDQGIALEELPPALQRFFVDAQGRSILNQNPNWRLDQAHRSGRFIGPVPRARIIDTLMGAAR